MRPQREKDDCPTKENETNEAPEIGRFNAMVPEWNKVNERIKVPVDHIGHAIELYQGLGLLRHRHHTKIPEDGRCPKNKLKNYIHHPYLVSLVKTLNDDVVQLMPRASASIAKK